MLYAVYIRYQLIDILSKIRTYLRLFIIMMISIDYRLYSILCIRLEIAPQPASTGYGAVFVSIITTVRLIGLVSGSSFWYRFQYNVEHVQIFLNASAGFSP